MSNDPVDGGTVTQQIEGQIVAVDFDRQTITLSFDEDARVPLTGDATVTFATVPESEPEPLVVECGDHKVELSDELVESFCHAWTADFDPLTSYEKAGLALAGLLRDARQDPQPSADTPSDDTPSGWYITTAGPEFTKGQVLSGPYSTRDDVFRARECVERYTKPTTYWVCPSTALVGDPARGGA